MNIEANIDEGRDLVQSLLGKPGIPFTGGTINEIPDESGIYLFSSRKTGESLYVGKSDKGIRSHMKDHWGGTEPGSSDLADLLVKNKIAQNRGESRDWIRENVVIRWLTREEIIMDIDSAENRVIQEIRPMLNRRLPNPN